MKVDYDIPDNLLYTRTHEWLRRGEDDPDRTTIGITDFAQDEVGDVVYVDLPAEGAEVIAGEPCAEIESTKTVAELYAPVTGEVIDTNDDLDGRPELVNASPYDEGWMIRVRIADEEELGGMLDAGAYRRLLREG